MTARGQLEGERFRKAAVLLGVLMVAVFATLQAVHAHPENGLAENPHCAICAAAHVRAIVVIPIIVVPALLFVHIAIVLFEPTLRSVLVLDSLFARPPPVAG